jgi:hypothetical protein
VLFKLANDPPSIGGFGVVVHEFSFFYILFISSSGHLFSFPPVFQVVLGREKEEGRGGSSSFSLLSPLNRA